ncbi:MAG: penicillin-binding protein 1C, partial [Deltaproteobacteria bacterium]|nr:penicillin-binding protein 1C [Deltaproteobacteria bacterium]
MILPLALLSLLFLFFWKCLPSPLFDEPFSHVILDPNKKLLGASLAEDEQWRFPPAAAAPEKFEKAITLYEDRRFFHHPGFDPIAGIRAVRRNIKAGEIVSGASTITMQVIRLSRKGRPRTLREKFIETVLALRLELSMSKEEILALFASHAPFGGNVVGIDAAAWRYFGRGPDRLSWAETAMLAVLPNSPSLIHPGRNRERLKKKRDNLLNRLAEQGFLDVLTCSLAKQEPLPPKPHGIPMSAPHLMNRIKIAHRSRPETKNSESTTDNGFRVQTTLDKDIQTRTAEIIKRHHKYLSASEIHNAAALILEVETGNALAYVGNIQDLTDKEHGNHVDIITAPRSTGSILKPILYAGMLQAGQLLQSQLVPDIPTRIGGFAPENYSRTYQGAVPAYMALARSLNVPSVRMLRAYGVDRFYTLLKRIGLSTLHRSARDYGLTLILGGAEGTLWDITGIYAGLARCAGRSFDGIRSGGSVFFAPEYSAQQRRDDKGAEYKVPPIEAGACRLTIQAMLEVTRPGQDSAWRHFTSSGKVSWKTGTSHGFRDGWAVGVTPRHAVGVWVGNADGEGRPGLTGIAAAAPILFEIFGTLETGKWFDFPEGRLVEIDVCAKSGYRAGPQCVDTKKISVPHAGLQSKCCPYCRIVHCDPTLKWRVNSECERVSEIKAVNWFILPPALEWFYKRKHSDYLPPPPFRPDCMEVGPGIGVA